MATKYLDQAGLQTLIDQITQTLKKYYLRSETNEIAQAVMEYVKESINTEIKELSNELHSNYYTTDETDGAIDAAKQDAIEVSEDFAHDLAVRIINRIDTIEEDILRDRAKLNNIESGAQVNVINSVGTGSQDGTISVNGVDVVVKGLGSAAFTDSSVYQPAGIQQMNYTIVKTLPKTGDSNTIYLIENKGEKSNYYDEYLWVKGTYELIGTTSTDLSDYYKKEEVDKIATRFYTRNEIADFFMNYYTKQEIDNSLSPLEGEDVLRMWGV